MEIREEEPQEGLRLVLKERRRNVDKSFDHYLNKAKARAVKKGFDGEIKIINDRKQVFFYVVIEI